MFPLNQGNTFYEWQLLRESAELLGVDIITLYHATTDEPWWTGVAESFRLFDRKVNEFKRASIF